MKRETNMKKITKIIATLFGLAFASFLPLSALHFSPEPAKADGLTHLGTVTIEEVKVYNPFGNTNEFLMLKLGGSDYPDSYTSAKEVQKATLTSRGYEIDLASSISFINSSGANVSVTDYYSVYSNQHHYLSYFSMWMAGMGGSKGAHIKSCFKIPSFALLNNDTSSPDYGYYTLDKDYELYANDIYYGMVADKVYDWHFEEYNPRNVNVTKVMSYVDGSHEMLTFELFGLGVDYPKTSGVGNFHFDVANASTLLPNFKDKVFLYDENRDSISYDFEFVCAIDLWTLYPRFSIGLTNLATAKYLKVFPGISFPSYAKYQPDTSSVVYDGFTSVNVDEMYLEIDSTASHTTGAVINWLESYNVVKNVSLAAYKTQRPFDNTNEFHIFGFNEQTDFAGKPNEHFSPETLLPNATTFIELYDNTDTKLTTHPEKTELMFNYGGSNNVCICLAQSQSAAKVILKEGLLFPSYALYSGDKTSPTYGYYYLTCDYTLLVPANDTHQKGVTYEWDLPKATVEYYDEDNNIISTYTDQAIYGSTYTLRNPIPKDSFYASWEVVAPASLVIDNGKVVVPFTGETIKFKAKYEVIPTCDVTYYDENDNVIPEYSKNVFCGQYYYLEPVISKKGHDASWVIIEPTTLTLDDNRVFIPDEVSIVKFKAHYELRTYTLSFEGAPSATKNVQYGANIGDLPEIPDVVSKTGYWVIGEEILTPETPYLWDENKTASLDYVDRICVLTFDTAGGSAVDSIEVLYGTSLSSLPITIKEGFYFDKWTLDAAGEIELTTDTIIENDYVVHAFWLKECIVTFDTDGGSLIESISVGEGSIIDKPLDPTREGFKFLYWTLNGQKYEFGQPITESITLKANWEKLPTEEDKDPNNKNNKTLLIVGIAVSSTLLVAGAGLMMFLLLKKKKV